MLLIEEMDKYLSYCKYQKELDDKTVLQQILLMKIKKDNRMFHVKHFVILF